MIFVLVMIIVVNGEPVTERVQMPDMQTCEAQAVKVERRALVAVCGAEVRE